MKTIGKTNAVLTSGRSVDCSSGVFISLCLVQFVNVGVLPQFLVVDGVHHFRPESEPEVEAPALAGGGEVVQEGVEAAVETHQG